MHKFFLAFLVLSSLPMTASSQKLSPYTMFLEKTVPANGEEVLFNAPILRWPANKGKNISYELQLSQNQYFTDTATINVRNLNGAFYNPHRKLSTGIWFWKFRKTGTDWSEIQHFVVKKEALPMVSPNASDFIGKIPNSHPRILVQEPATQRISFQNSPDAQAILIEAENALTTPLIIENQARTDVKGVDANQTKKLKQDAIIAMSQELHQVILPLCQANFLRPQPSLQKKALLQALEIASWDANGISSESDFTDGICMYDMALVYDTYFDQLNEAQKSTLQKAITIRADAFFNNWKNNIESKLLSGHVWQLLLNEFFKTSLALYGHEPKAKDWLTYAYELFLARAPVLGGIDGGWAEGAYYFTMNMETLVEIPEKIKSYTGFDFIAAHPWYRNNADWLIYHIPPSSSANGFGDNTEELYKAPNSYAAFANIMGRILSDKKYTWYAENLIHSQQLDLSKEPTLRWYRLTHSQTLPPFTQSQELSLPQATVAVEQGLAALHTDYKNTAGDIMVSFRSSPFGAYGHILADQNTFNVLAGGKRLFYRTGYKVSMDDPHRIGWSKHTKSQNGILINGNGQPYTSDAYGRIQRFLQGDELSYVMGDASNAYKSRESKENFGMKKFNRHLLLLKPGILVVYDELESDSAATWAWLLHSMERMHLDTISHTFYSTAGSFKGKGKLWSSAPFRWNLSDSFDVPAKLFRHYKGMLTQSYDDNQWHLKAYNTTQEKSIRFLSIIYIGKNSNEPKFLVMPSQTGSLLLKLGGWEIEANLDTQLPPLLRIHSDHTAFSAFGGEWSLDKNTLGSFQNKNSWIYEKNKAISTWKEAKDLPLPVVR